MNKSGTVCKECIAHHYWHHMDNRKRFFKVMVGDFKNGVTIPRKFVANIGEKISEEVKLQVPNGKTYTIEVAEKQNELVLRSGWADFASAYELGIGDFLVFRSSGNSHFTVRIYDPSGCEKELSCVMLDSAPCMQESKVSCGKQMQSPTGKRVAVGSPRGCRKTPKINPTDSPSEKETEHVPSSEGIQEHMYSGAFQKPTRSFFALPRGCSLASEQKDKVIALEQKIQPKIPFYITAMYKKSLAYGILAIRKEYVMKHLANENGTIQISQLDGSKVWNVNLDMTTDGRYAVSTGWLDFIRDNKLGEGDICIFQPTKSKNIVKLIFHTLEERCCLQSPGYVPSAKSPRHGVAEPPYMLSRYTSLTYKQKSKVEEEVRAIQSEIPVYVAVINKSNVNGLYVLGFGSDYARKYLPLESQTMRLRRPGASCKEDACKPNFRVNNGRQCLSGKGWKKFVDDNKLKPGDICIFSLAKNTKTLTMDVHIIRKRSV